MHQRVFYLFLSLCMAYPYFYASSKPLSYAPEQISDICIGWRDYCSDPYRIYLAHSEGDGIGYEGGYSTVGVFTAPSWSSRGDLQPFFDGKALLFNDGRLGANIGIGARWVLPNLPAIMGVNVYYDYLDEHRLSFQQIGVGYELFTPCFDFRVNGYFPIGNKCQVTNEEIFDSYIGSYEFRCADQYTPFIGVDAELGTWIGSCCSCSGFGIYLAAGPYYYQREKCCGNFCGKGDAFGGRGRIMASFCGCLSMNASVSYDSYWKGRGQVQLVLCLPFDRCFWKSCCSTGSKCGLLQRLARQPVYRQEIIPIDKQDVFSWNWSTSARSSCCSR